MSPAQLSAELREIVQRHSRIRPERVLDHHVLARDLGFDSLAFLLTLTDLETRYRFDFPLELIDELQNLSFGELRGLVAGQLELVPGFTA